MYKNITGLKKLKIKIIKKRKEKKMKEERKKGWTVTPSVGKDSDSSD